MNVALKQRLPHAPELPAATEASDQLKPLYLETLNRIERLHRQLLDVIKDEFERLGRSDLTPVQREFMREALRTGALAGWTFVTGTPEQQLMIPVTCSCRTQAAIISASLST